MLGRSFQSRCSAHCWAIPKVSPPNQSARTTMILNELNVPIENHDTIISAPLETLAQTPCKHSSSRRFCGAPRLDRRTRERARCCRQGGGSSGSSRMRRGPVESTNQSLIANEESFDPFSLPCSLHESTNAWPGWRSGARRAWDSSRKCRLRVRRGWRRRRDLSVDERSERRGWTRLPDSDSMSHREHR